jgi:lipoyl(octanoyl) transferase
MLRLKSADRFTRDSPQLSTRCYVDYLQRLLAEYCTEDMALQNILAPHPDGHVGVFSSPTEKVRSSPVCDRGDLAPSYP